MIPDEALDAAWKMLWESGETNSRERLRAAIEAAAPYLAAAAKVEVS